MSDELPSSPILVRDLMTVGVVTCPPQTPLTEVAQILLEKDLEGLVVLGDDGQALGIVTRNDLVYGYGHPKAGSLKAEDVMQEGIPEIPPDIPLAAAAQLMQDMGLRIVFLMHNAAGVIYPAAMLSYKHILRHLAAESDEDLHDLGIEARREAPLDMFRRKRDAARRQNQLPNQE